jgi:drug/metabolite transporter (DMT)-like permease
MSKIIVFIIAISLSAITVLADFFTKKASLFENVWNKWLFAAAVVYGITAIGWVFTMKNAKLSTLGVIYGVSCIIMLTFISVYFFHEKLSLLEIIGILLGMLSLVVLYRFS